MIGIWQQFVRPQPTFFIFYNKVRCYNLLSNEDIHARASLRFRCHWFQYETARSKCDQIRSDQSLSRVWLFATPWIAALQASLSITNSWSSLRLTSIESVMPSSPHPLSSPSPLAPNPSQHQSLFQWVNSSHEVAKVLEFQL